jgi:hypothetical protein
MYESGSELITGGLEGNIKEQDHNNSNEVSLPQHKNNILAT